MKKDTVLKEHASKGPMRGGHPWSPAGSCRFRGPPFCCSLLMAVLLLWPVCRAEADPLKDGADAYKNGAYEDALKLFVDAQLKDPRNPEVLYNLGNAYYKTGDYQSAYDHFQEAMQAQDEALKQKAVYNMGNTRFRQGRFKEAIEHYEQALELDPEDTSAKENIAFVKKVMQQQKAQEKAGEKGEGEEKEENSPRQSSDQTGSQSDDNGGEQAEQDHRSTTREKQEQPGDEATQFGDRMPKDKSGQPEESNTTGTQSSPQPADKGALTDESTEGQEEMTLQQIERVLNRLKDRPGRPAVPAQQGHGVEQDW